MPTARSTPNRSFSLPSERTTARAESDDGSSPPPEDGVNNKVGQRLGARGRRTRDRFLEAARALLSTTSPIDLTARAIALAAGSSPPGFFVYFDDVREVMLALCAEASASAETMLPRTDSLLDPVALEEDVAVMVAAVRAAWDRNAAVLLYRNHEADRGDERFDAVRTQQAQPLLDRLREAIARHRRSPISPQDAFAEAAVLVAAIERIAARTHGPTKNGATVEQLEAALVRVIVHSIRRWIDTT